MAIAKCHDVRLDLARERVGLGRTWGRWWRRGLRRHDVRRWRPRGLWNEPQRRDIDAAVRPADQEMGRIAGGGGRCEQTGDDDDGSSVLMMSSGAGDARASLGRRLLIQSFHHSTGGAQGPRRSRQSVCTSGARLQAKPDPRAHSLFGGAGPITADRASGGNCAKTRLTHRQRQRHGSHLSDGT